MLIIYWIWNSYPFRLRSKGFQIWPYSQLQQSGYLLQPDHSDAIDVFDKTALLELRRAVHLQSHL
jgi:hypothetical protein